MDPTLAEFSTWTKIDDVLDWVGIAGVNADTKTPRGSFMALIGLAGTDHWRPLASMPEADFQAILAAWTISDGTTDAAPTPGVLAQAGIIGRSARIAGGVQKSAVQLAQELADDAAHTRALAIAAAAPQPKAQALAVAARTVPMRDVADVARNDEVPVMSEIDLANFFKTYKRLMHRDPPWEEEPTTDQITAVHTLVGEHVPPYVDLSIFGPHGQRTLRNIKLMGLTLSSTGELQRVELRGPPTVEAWEACMLVFKTIVIGLEIMLPPFIDDYIKKVKGYARRYGPVAWALIYQMDVRFRREWCERIRRSEAEAHQQAVANGGTTSYDPAHPWQRVYEVGVHSSADFWHQHLEEPCQCVCAKAHSVGAFVEGDAPVSTAGSHLPSMGAFAPSIASGASAGTSDRKRGSAVLDPYPTIVFPKAKQRVRQHNVDSSGLLTTNRGGHELCRGWQDGTCMETGPNFTCSKNSGRKHQCAKCLSTEHGANAPSPCTRQATVPSVVNSPKGKGSKGGKSKGKKGGVW